MNLELPLTSLRDGESGVITSIKPRGSGKYGGLGLQRRLLEMGLTPGTEVMIIKSSPFGGPLEVQVRGSRLAIGRGVAERIYVRVER
ncbi:MAG: FeoA family protein [Candidatus Bathyarchaeia archaeon]